MKTTTKKTPSKRRLLGRRRIKKGRPPGRIECVHRVSPCEFSCGIDDHRALLVEESLDERERRG